MRALSIALSAALLTAAAVVPPAVPAARAALLAPEAGSGPMEGPVSATVTEADAEGLQAARAQPVARSAVADESAPPAEPVAPAPPAPAPAAPPPPPAAAPGTGLTVVASWYGPGFWGNRTACGLTLTADLRGVAHRTLPCGSAVTLRYGAATVTVPVVDRGPHVAGREFDLTQATRIDLGCRDLCRLEWLR